MSISDGTCTESLTSTQALYWRSLPKMSDTASRAQVLWELLLVLVNLNARTLLICLTGDVAPVTVFFANLSDRSLTLKEKPECPAIEESLVDELAVHSLKQLFLILCSLSSSLRRLLSMYVHSDSVGVIIEKSPRKIVLVHSHFMCVEYFLYRITFVSLSCSSSLNSRHDQIRIYYLLWEHNFSWM